MLKMGGVRVQGFLSCDNALLGDMRGTPPLLKKIKNLVVDFKGAVLGLSRDCAPLTVESQQVWLVGGTNRELGTNPEADWRREAACREMVPDRSPRIALTGS